MFFVYITTRDEVHIAMNLIVYFIRTQETAEL